MKVLDTKFQGTPFGVTPLPWFYIINNLIYDKENISPRAFEYINTPTRNNAYINQSSTRVLSQYYPRTEQVSLINNLNSNVYINFFNNTIYTYNSISDTVYTTPLNIDSEYTSYVSNVIYEEGDNIYCTLIRNISYWDTIYIYRYNKLSNQIEDFAAISTVIASVKFLTSDSDNIYLSALGHTLDDYGNASYSRYVHSVVQINKATLVSQFIKQTTVSPEPRFLNVYSTDFKDKKFYYGYICTDSLGHFNITRVTYPTDYPSDKVTEQPEIDKFIVENLPFKVSLNLTFARNSGGDSNTIYIHELLSEEMQLFTETSPSSETYLTLVTAQNQNVDYPLLLEGSGVYVFIDSGDSIDVSQILPYDIEYFFRKDDILILATDTQLIFLKWNSVTKNWDEINKLNSQNTTDMGFDLDGLFWYSNQDGLFRLTLNQPEKLVVEFIESNLVYEGLNVNTAVKVWATNYLGSQIKTKTKLQLAGNAVFENNTQILDVVLDKDIVNIIPIVITGAGKIEINLKKE